MASAPRPSLIDVLRSNREFGPEKIWTSNFFRGRTILAWPMLHHPVMPITSTAATQPMPRKPP
ncbi:MAG: hypothetical protein ABSC33_08965, partial [Candidatus Sulfotelmatobacter sp.]